MHKLRFQQFNEKLVHVIFTKDCPYEEGLTYQLSGWQMLSTRHNVIAINEE